MGEKRVLASLLCLSLVLTMTGVIYGTDKQEPMSLYIIERDTLQTRNFTPIVNHQTMVFNPGEKPVTLELISKIPAGKDREGGGYPAFLGDSLLPDPLFSIIEISPKKTSYLARPETISEKGHVSYVWKGITLPPGENVIAQYDNFLGEQNYYWKKDGFDFQGLKAKTAYEVRKVDSSDWELSLKYDIQNTTKNSIKELVFGVFVPVRQIGRESETVFLDIRQICSSPNVEPFQITKSDGFGEAAFGVAGNLMIRELEAGSKASFIIRIVGFQGNEKGTIWPLINVSGRILELAVWPQTIVKANVPISEERFNYLSYNLVIKDNRMFVLSRKGITVKSAQ
jgi:hypothetical protein